jgi:hypothetical protein
MSTKRILGAGGLALAILACAAPTRDLDTQEIEAITELEELMYVKATVADPRFKLAKGLGQRPLTDEEWAAFVDMGARLQVTSRHGLRFSMGPGFDAYLSTLGEQATALEAAARDHDRAATVELALSIKGTCAACHDDFR